MQLPDHIKEDIRQRLGLEEDDTSRDDEIDQMDLEQALDKHLGWQGIMGFTSGIIDVVKCFGAQDKRFDADEQNELFAIEPAQQMMLAYQILFDLQTKLTNSYLGKPKQEHDQAVKALFDLNKKALDTLDADKWIPHLKVLQQYHW